MLLQQKNQRSSTKAPTGGAGLLEVRAQQSESFHDAETQVESAAATVFHLATKDLQPPSHCAHTEADAIPLDQTEGGCQLSQKPIFVPHHFGPQVNVWFRVTSWSMARGLWRQAGHDGEADSSSHCLWVGGPFALATHPASDPLPFPSHPRSPAFVQQRQVVQIGGLFNDRVHLLLHSQLLVRMRVATFQLQPHAVPNRCSHRVHCSNKWMSWWILFCLKI